MGKVIFYLSMLIFIDLLLIVTGQLCGSGSCTLNSIFINALIDLNSLPFSEFVSELIGSLTDFASSSKGVLALVAGAIGVTVAALVTKSDTILFIPIAGTIAVMGSDFLVIFVELFNHSPILAMFFMAPIVITFYLTILDWTRGRD